MCMKNKNCIFRKPSVNNLYGENSLTELKFIQTR